MKAIPEKDWKLLRSMKDAKLNQACEQILGAVVSVIINKGNENHKAYLEVWEKIQTGDNEIGEMFNDLRRSNAVLKLVAWKRYGFLTESELNGFSEETQSTIEAIAGN
jgi:hypothetical protein